MRYRLARQRTICLEADFPRFAAPFRLPSEDAAALDIALRENNLVRGETRLDQHGIAVVARRRGEETLFLLRVSGGSVHIRPHVPARDIGSTDQQRWMRYTETYEAMTILDAWHDGAGEDVIVLTGDLSGQVCRHHIDIDGVETWSKTDDEAAAGALHREHLFPGTLTAADDTAVRSEAMPTLADPLRAEQSLLARAEAYVRANNALAAVRDGADAAAPLREFAAALHILDANSTAAMLQSVQRQPDAAAVAGLQQALQAELALTQCHLVPPRHSLWLTRAGAPFGDDVAAALPDATYQDIEEAALCLALSRPTASVFHCTKALRAGIAGLARIAGVADPIASGGSDWQAISARCISLPILGSNHR